MAGRSQQMSFDEFSIVCGFYNADDRHEYWFQQLVPYKGTPQTTPTERQFWADMTKDGDPVYVAGKFQGTYFSNPLFRFLFYGFSRSLIPKNESHGHAGLKELYLTRSMVQATPIHLGYLVAHAF
ncbi:hypothetical protein LINGRAHAP2_LOCUS11209 [Linum grandiflorum]